ncbi:hypothetical protein DSM43518_04760 [Mycobacterium marinum]|uniref:Uncharacterized protein n=1 Tax=Mycobacterium marinum TaxID=1781 RepID=A0A2Z5YJB2_MYCMR|nr:holin [Mycobacterium marinum]AXN43483.1 hypothetical protein MM1218R_01535 [Mycobacterium marinum]AXN51218.1 hypothetical protein CCUG20998_03822 [Mycobacterium marinum]RFZ02773.1 hypothetical protein DSM43518_04760 [Mycobacterium marinum]RFZ11465.1 hypothetical protein DE4381_01053 [Mycobacterium marinum]RFZ25964.1 hypothetical protein DSM43519_01278 [Mycobacterium marinum]
MPKSIFTKIFWKDTIDRAVAAGGAAAVAAWTLGAFNVVPSVPGYAVPIAFACGAGQDILRSLASLRVDNGTASPLADVVAADRTTQPR